MSTEDTNNLSSNSTEVGDLYTEMSLPDKLLFTIDHFETVKKLIIDYEDLTHIVTNISFMNTSIDKYKLIKDNKLENNKENITNPYIFATVVTKINRDLDGYDLITSNILLKIQDYIKKYILYH